MGVTALPPERQLIIYDPTGTPPAGYIKANGAALDRVVYSWLFAKIGTTYGVGDGSTTFNIPDLRGVAVRGLDDGRGLDAGRALGSYQGDVIASHAVTITDPGHSHLLTNSAGQAVTDMATGSSPPRSVTTNPATSSVVSGQWKSDTKTTGITASYTGGTETRMKNVALLGCIAYAP